MKLKDRIRHKIVKWLFGFPTRPECWRCYNCLWVNTVEDPFNPDDSVHCEKCGCKGAVSCDGYIDEDEINHFNKELG